MHKFLSSDDIDQGKEIRAELDFANTLPYGLNVNVGTEYYYDDNTGRGLSFTFRVGIPLYHNGERYNQDYRMVKSIVRDVDIQLNQKTINTPSAVTVSGVAFHQIDVISTEEELIEALKKGVSSNENQLIVLKKHISVITAMNICDNRKIVSNI